MITSCVRFRPDRRHRARITELICDNVHVDQNIESRVVPPAPHTHSVPLLHTLHGVRQHILVARRASMQGAGFTSSWRKRGTTKL